jgi:ABC-type branched-subunit amino acid transport system substrate-binding protein
MRSRFSRAATLAAIALLAVGCSSSKAKNAATVTTNAATGSTSGGSNTASDTGVTADKIKVGILAADLSGLVKAGAIKGVPADAAVINAKRISYYLDKWNASGGINGRTFDYQLFTWDPADPTSFNTACQKIIDAKVFAVINPGGGFNPDFYPCITSDGKTLFLGVEGASKAAEKASGANLITIGPAAEVEGAAGIQALINNPTILPKSSKIAVLRGDNQFQIDSWNEVKRALDSAGYSVVYSDPQKVATLPTADANKGIVLNVEKVKASGADHVINMLPFTNFSVFPPEAKKAGLDLKYTTVEISSGMCTAFSAGQAPAETDGTTCATHWDNFRIDTKSQTKTDSPFEAQCRTDFEAAYKDPVGSFKPITKTTPGVPFPGLTDATGTFLTQDQSYYECTQMNVFQKGISGAGANLTKQSFSNALYKVGTFDVAGASNGKGTLAPNKPWLTTAVHIVQLSAIKFTDPKDASGLYGGKCLSPLSCFRVVTPDTWTPLTATL